MRISDWSSDVCSSDLLPRKAISGVTDHLAATTGLIELLRVVMKGIVVPAGGQASAICSGVRYPATLLRSEEHTSELQSLMRISYAVFCLKKKKPSPQQTTKIIVHSKSIKYQNETT